MAGSWDHAVWFRQSSKLAVSMSQKTEENWWGWTLYLVGVDGCRGLLHWL